MCPTQSRALYMKKIAIVLLMVSMVWGCYAQKDKSDKNAVPAAGKAVIAVQNAPKLYKNFENRVSLAVYNYGVDEVELVLIEGDAKVRQEKEGSCSYIVYAGKNCDIVKLGVKSKKDGKIFSHQVFLCEELPSPELMLGKVSNQGEICYGDFTNASVIAKTFFNSPVVNNYTIEILGQGLPPVKVEGNRITKEVSEKVLADLKVNIKNSSFKYVRILIEAEVTDPMGNRSHIMGLWRVVE